MSQHPNVVTFLWRFHAGRLYTALRETHVRQIVVWILQYICAAITGRCRPKCCT